MKLPHFSETPLVIVIGICCIISYWTFSVIACLVYVLLLPFIASTCCWCCALAYTVYHKIILPDVQRIVHYIILAFNPS